MQKNLESHKQNLSLAKLIDHTALKQEDFERNKLLRLSQEVLDNKFNSICIRPGWLAEFFIWCREKKLDTPKISVVIGFPHSPFAISDISLKEALKLSHIPLQEKINETRKAIEILLANSVGFIELDPVLDISKIESENFTESLADEITAYLNLCIEYTGKNPNLKIFLKPIFSSELLIKQALASQLNKDYFLELSVKALCLAYHRVFDLSQKLNERVLISYKNSTGFVTDEDLEKGSYLAGSHSSLICRIAKLLDQYEEFYRLAPNSIGIKAAAGIRDRDTVSKIIHDGKGRITHIGTSSGLTICQN
jgi:deoxyribose-phosphate aldolase